MLSSFYTLPIDAVRSIDTHREALTMVPKQNTLMPGKRAAFDAYRQTDTELIVPRFYGLQHFGEPSRTCLSDGESVPLLSFSGTLRDVQHSAHERTVAQLRSTGGAILVFACGGGKTVLALRIMATIRRTTYVFVHKSFLIEQWTERIRQFLPDARIGRVQQARVDVEDKDVVLVMLQSAAQRAYPDDVFANVGLAVFDECHHMAAPQFFSVLGKIRPRYILGLTATEERSDGLTRLLHFGLGSPLRFTEAASGERDRVHVRLRAYGGGGGDVRNRNGQVLLPAMNAAVAADAVRNGLLVDAIAEYVARGDGRHILVLSSLLLHLEELRAMLASRGLHDVGVLTGKTPSKERAAAVAHAIVLATYGMAREALDVPTLNTLVLATPSGDVEQAVGRIQRSGNDAAREVFDVVDERAVFFGMLARKRQRFYRQRGFTLSSVR